MRSAPAGWGTEYQTSTYSSFDHISRYVFATSSRRCDAAARNHGSSRPKLHAVAVEAHDELLARADAHVLAALREVGLGLGDEAIAHRLELRPVRRVRERARRTARREKPFASTSARIRLWTSSSVGRLGLEARTALAVREHAVVQLVRRADPATLDRLRDAVGAVREHAVHAACELCRSLCIVSWRRPAAGRLRYLPSFMASGLLRVPRLAASGGGRSRRLSARPSATSSSGSTSSSSAAGRVATTSSARGAARLGAGQRVPR